MGHRLAVIFLIIAIAGCSTQPAVRTAPIPASSGDPGTPAHAAQDSVSTIPDTAALPTVRAPDAAPATLPPRLENLLASFDDHALAGQMIVTYRAHNSFLLEHGFGGVLLFAPMLKNPVAVRASLDSLQAAAPIPYLVCLDQEGGEVSRLDALPGRTDGTPSAAIMATWSADQVQAHAREIGATLSALGVNLNLAPVLDSRLAWNDQPSWMGIRDRAFGAEASAILPPAAAFARGCREAGVLCLAKHFPGYDVASNSDHEPAHSGADFPAIQTGAARFEAIGDASAGVMMASIIYPPLGDAPAVFSPRAVKMAHAAVPEGLVMTDDLWGTALRSWLRPDLEISPRDYPEADWALLTEIALRAGNDLLLITYPAKAVAMQETIVRLMREDPDVRRQVVTAVRRILRAKAALGLIRPM